MGYGNTELGYKNDCKAEPSPSTEISLKKDNEYKLIINKITGNNKYYYWAVVEKNTDIDKYDVPAIYLYDVGIVTRN